MTKFGIKKKTTKIYLVIRFSKGTGQPLIRGGRFPVWMAHIIVKAVSDMWQKGFWRANNSHKIMLQLNTSHFSV